VFLDAIKEPWLQAVATGGVYVLLEADSQLAAVVDYGLTSDYGKQAITESTEYTDLGKYVHNIELTGLQSNTQYHYRVTQGATITADQMFWTSPEAATDFRFAFLADCRTNTTIHAQVASLVDTFDPRMAVWGGDLVEAATWGSWDEQFFLPEQEALNAQVPFFNATGNHEGWNALTRAYTQGPTASGETNGYYSFDYGDAHFLILNNEVSYSQGSPQWDFAASDLSSTTQPWKFVVYHKPAYAAGGHGEDADMKAMSTSIFEPYGVDMTLTGHDHFYQHNLVNGIHHMVIGSTGAPLYDPGTASYTVYTEKTYCFGIFDMTPTTLNLNVYDEVGVLIENINLVNAPDTTAPALDSVSATSSTAVQVVFSEPVEQTSAETATNYAIDKAVALSAAVLQADGRTVLLTTSTLTQGTTYTLTVNSVQDLAGNTIAANTQETFQYAVNPIQLVFQQGLGGYAGTVDTYLRQASPTTNYAMATSLNVDADEPPGSGSDAQALLRFEDIFGSGPGRVPVGARIVSCELRLQVFDPGNGLKLHRMLRSWLDTDTWNSLVGGIQADNVEASATADASTAAVGTGTLIIDVTVSLAAWQSSPSSNFGWAILPTGNDGVDFYSAQGTTPPKLIVTFIPSEPNTPPVAADDAYTVNEDTTLTVLAPGVLANDSDLDQDLLWALLVAAPAHGSLTLNVDGSFTYRPNQNYNGPDSFTYKANDGHSDSNVATVSLTVSSVNDAPVAANDAYSVNQDTALTVVAPGVLGNDTDVENDPLSAHLVTSVAHGTLVLNADGSFQYTPSTGYTGSDSFVYKANDGSADSNLATVTITVKATVHDFYALSESTTSGTKSGDYTNTGDSDNKYEALTEILSAKKSILEHTWRFNLSGGTTRTFYVEAYKSGTEDNFKFQYSTNGSAWTDMLTVTKTSDNNTAQSYSLPGGLSGTVYVRVIDTNRAANKTVLDTLYVDLMYIRCA
jgi:VCBS repeat-containing protein